MKKLLTILLGSLLLTPGLKSLYAQNYVPTPVAGYTLVAGSWTPAASTASGGTTGYVPDPVALYCYNSGTGKWVPADSSCFGGGSGTFVTLSGDAISQADGGATTVVGINGVLLSGLANGPYYFTAGVPTTETAAQAIAALGSTPAINCTNCTNLPSPTSTANIAGGAANDIPYQTGASTTSFITPVDNAVLCTSAGGVPSECTTLPSGITLVAPALGTPASGVVTNLTGTGAFSTTGNAGTATLATTATNVGAGTANQIPYQTGAGATSFISAVDNAVLCTSSGGVPSECTTLPSGITLVAPALGTPASGVVTNLTGTGAFSTTGNAGTVTTAVSSTSSVFSILAAASTTGSQAPVTVANFTVNPGTGAVVMPGSINMSVSGDTIGVGTTTITFNSSSNILTVSAGGVSGAEWVDASGTLDFKNASNVPFMWSSTTAPTGTIDTVLSRASAGVIEINAGTTPGATGTLDAATIETAALTQQAASNTGGTCSMVSATSCTITIAHTYTTPVCIVTQQSATLTGGAVGCTVSSTTVTITAATSNSETWGALVFGNPT